MGLDIYLYSVSKPSNLKNGQYVNQNNNVTLLPVLDGGKKKRYCKTILNNSVKVKCINKKTDYDKIYKDYSKKNLDKSDINIVSVNLKGYTFRIDGEIIVIDTSTLRNNYSYEVTEEYYAVKLCELEYQRGLSEEGRLLLPPNCEYCDNKKIIDKLVKNGLDYCFERTWVSGKTVLLAWW